MSEVGERMVKLLERIHSELVVMRETLGGEERLGFGAGQKPNYIFLNHPQVPEDMDYFWYTKRREEKDRTPRHEHDFTGYIRNALRLDYPDRTGAIKPWLHIHLYARELYVLKTGFRTNFSISFQAALAELEPKDLEEPIMLLTEPSQGKRSFASLFCRLVVRGKRLDPVFSKQTDVKALYETNCAKFGFGTNPLADEVGGDAGE
jgi:hypothetical protein